MPGVAPAPCIGTAWPPRSRRVPAHGIRFRDRANGAAAHHDAALLLVPRRTRLLLGVSRERFDSALRQRDAHNLTAMRPPEDPLGIIVLRLLYTAAVMVVVIWLLRTGNPVGGLLVVPAAAVWLRRDAESGRLAARVRRAHRH